MILSTILLIELIEFAVNSTLHEETDIVLQLYSVKLRKKMFKANSELCGNFSLVVGDSACQEKL